jgi:hypothetical protein
MPADPKQSLRDKFIMPVVVGVSISIITAILIGEGRFAPRDTAAGQPTSPGAIAQPTATLETAPTMDTPTRGPVEPEATAPVLPTPVAEERNLTALSRIHASSVLPEEQIAGLGLVLYIPENAIDRDPTTSWVEGVGGPGIGEQLSLDFSRPVTLTRFGIRVGFDRDDDIFFKNHRLRRARLLFSDGASQNVEFEDRRGMQFVSIAHVRTTSLIIVIDQVYQSGKYDDTPIAEVEVWGYESP